MMEFSAAQIAALLGGTVEGNENTTVSNLSKIEEGVAGTLSFLANPKYTNYIYDTNASIVIVNKTLTLERPVKEGCTLIRVEDSYASFATLYWKCITSLKVIKLALNSLLLLEKSQLMEQIATLELLLTLAIM
jgi:UDP-3-O-[3-hydroxymyristoyl] glucosamine N-acyltransferase